MRGPSPWVSTIGVLGTLGLIAVLVSPGSGRSPALPDARETSSVALLRERGSPAGKVPAGSRLLVPSAAIQRFGLRPTRGRLVRSHWSLAGQATALYLIPGATGACLLLRFTGTSDGTGGCQSSSVVEHGGLIAFDTGLGYAAGVAPDGVNSVAVRDSAGRSHVARVFRNGYIIHMDRRPRSVSFYGHVHLRSFRVP